jgi:hypothetical protein
MIYINLIKYYSIAEFRRDGSLYNTNYCVYYVLIIFYVFVSKIMYRVILNTVGDRLCGLVVRVPGYRSRGPGFDSRRYQIF